MKIIKFNENVDTKRQEIVDYYFQLIQNKIKELLEKDNRVKSEDIQKFNDLIFTQHEYDIRKDLETYINDMYDKKVDEEEVAKNILSKYYTMIYNNEFNKDNVNDVENPLEERIYYFDEYIKESKEIKTFIVNRNSYFDFNKYDIDKMNKIFDKYNLATWVEKDKGWNNQPEVLCFLSHENLIKKIEEDLNSDFKTQWISIHEKDW